MAGDYTRLTFDPRLDRAMVLEQQGRVHLDADWNELVAILERRLRVETYDFAGPAVVPASEPDSFKLVVQGGKLFVTRGRIYVDGLLAENHGEGQDGYEPVWGESIGKELLLLEDEPYAGSEDAVKRLHKQLLSGDELVYLDVWQREVTVVEDPSVLEPALGVDTCTRVQTVWQIRALKLDQKAPRCGDDWSKYEPWLEETAPSAGRLTVQAVQPPAPDDPCAIAPVGGYRGKENRLYRVEIHDGGGSGDAVTFKWSRDNGAVASRIVGPITDATTKPVVPVERLGRDDVLRFVPTDWVELLDDAHELDGTPGIIAQVDSVDQAQQTITLTAPFPAGETIDENRNPRIRRWDQTAGLTNGVVPADFGTPIDLEDGIQVTLTLADAGGRVRTGDWWVFAARAATASVEELDEAPPRGIRHHYARLGILEKGKVVDDCRVVFPGDCECEDGCACTVCVTPQSHAGGDGPLTIQNAIDRVVKTGGRVCLTSGLYELQEPLRIEGARSLALSGEGESTVISYVGDGLGIVVLDSVDVVLERFAIAVARASNKDFAATRERAQDVVTNQLTMTKVPSFTAAPVGEQTIAIALVNTAACRVERCFAISGFAPGRTTSGLSINGSLGIGLGGWSIDTRIADNIVFSDVAIGDLTIGRAGVTTAFAYDHVGIATSYSANVDLEITDNLLLGLSAGIDFGSLPPRPNGEKAAAAYEANIGPSLHLGLTRVVDNLVLGPRAVGIALVNAAAGASTSTGMLTAKKAAPARTLEATETLDTAEPDVTTQPHVGLATANATHTAAASLVLLGELAVGGLNRVDIVGNVLELSGIGVVTAPGNLRIEGNDITGETGSARFGRGGGILLTLGTARQGRSVIVDNAVRAVAGFGIGWSGAPGWLEVRSNRLAGVAGYGIAGAINSRPDVVTIEDNTVEDVQIGGTGLAYAVQASGALVAEIRANRVRGVGTSTDETGGRAGILVSGCGTTSVTDNILVAIGPAGEQAGIAYGIGYGGSLEVLDVRGNVVELSQGSGTRDIPLAVFQSSWKVSDVGVAEVGASDHLAVLAESVRTENPAVLTPVFERAREAANVKEIIVRDAQFDPVPPGAGDVAIVDNTLRSSSPLPLVWIAATANVTFAQNRVVRASGLLGTSGVLATTRGAVIVSSNRVETAKNENAPASMALFVNAAAAKNDPHCTVLGNITSRPILLNGSALPAPWEVLNIVA